MPKSSHVPEIEFIALIATLMALVALAINMILPAFAVMTTDFELSTSTQIGLVVSLLYVGLAVGQITFGALSDSIGRKPAMNAGLMIFVAGAALSWGASTFEVLIAGQIIQGIGLGAPRVVTVAIVRDRFKGAMMARTMSFIMVVFAIVPTISPYIGQAIVLAVGWRALFLVFVVGTFIISVWFTIRFSETHPKRARSEFLLGSTLRNVWSVLTNRPAMLHAAALGSVSGAFIAYLNLSQQILQFQYGLGAQYPLYFAVMSLSLATASLINGRAVVTVGLVRLTLIGLIGMAGTSALLIANMMILQSDPSFPHLLGYLMTMLFCFGILVSNLNALAMRSLGATAGTGAALVGALTTFISVPLAILIGQSYDGSILPLVVAFGMFALVGACLVGFAAMTAEEGVK